MKGALKQAGGALWEQQHKTICLLPERADGTAELVEEDTVPQHYYHYYYR